MQLETIVFEISIIIVGAAVLGTLFLYAKQPILIAYIAIGILLGPNALGIINRVDHIEQISHLGIILLLFIIGLHLQPVKLIKTFQKTSLITLGTSLVFAGTSFLFFYLLGFDIRGALIFGVSMMFSSTIISLKLIPTTTLHHKRKGEIMTSVLLIQDILAILVILFITGEKSEALFFTFIFLAVKFAALCLLAFAGVRFIIIPLLKKFDVIQEYTFVAALGWCMLCAEAAHIFGLSYEIGAFVGGLSIASSRIALIIAEHLKPLREFFLILFFFAVGAKLNLRLEPKFLILAALFGAVLVPLKVLLFRIGFKMTGETETVSGELAVRLAQASEFSLLVAFAAISMGILSDQMAMMLQVATITTFIISTYWVVFRYSTPISADSSNRRD